MRKTFIIIGILLFFFFLYLLSPLLIERFFLYFINKNLGGKVQVEKITFVFPNKVYANNVNLDNKVFLANVALSVGNVLKLSPINLELVKPKIVIIHNEKGEWIFPSIPGISGNGGRISPGINLEIKARIKEGIVVVKSLQSKKEVEVSKVNGELSFKDQKLTYTATYLSSDKKIESDGVYDFSRNSGRLNFTFENAEALDWAPFFVPSFFNVKSGRFTGKLSVIGDGKEWYVEGNINAKNVEAEFKDFNLIVKDINMNIEMNKNGIEIKKGQGNWEGTLINISGKVTPELSLDLSLQALDLSKIDNLYLGKALSLIGKGEGNLKIEGRPENPKVLGEIIVKEGSLYNISFYNFKLSSNSNFPKLNIEIALSLGEGSIKGNLEYDVEKKEGNLNLMGEKILIQNFVKPLNLPPVEGLASLIIKGKGERIWKFSIEGEVYQGGIGEYSAEKVNFSFEGEWDLSSFFFQTK